MAQTLYTKTQVDENGEFKTREWLTKTVKNTEQFIRTYTDDICKLAKCNRSEQSFILCSLSYLDYDTNELVLNPSRRREICECAQIKSNTFNIAVSTLYKKNILIRQEGKTYLNPKLFFYGSEVARNQYFRLIINYRIEQPSLEG